MGVGHINTDCSGSHVREERRVTGGEQSEYLIPCVVDLAHIYPDCLRYANSVGWQMSWDPGGRVVHWRVLGWR